jgi:hypothetical protein
MIWNEFDMYILGFGFFTIAIIFLEIYAKVLMLYLKEKLYFFILSLLEI